VNAFHNAKMAQERERVALRIANGTKASSNLVIGHRMQHPSYKGLIDNSTGSRIQPFFASKDESQFPLEDKIAMRGGVLSTEAGMKFAKAALRRRAEDLVNQKLAADGLPVNPPKLMELDETESKSLELNQILESLADSAEAGAFFNFSISEVSKLPRLVISLLPTFSEGQIVELINALDNIVQLAMNISSERSLKAATRFGDIEDEATRTASSRAIKPMRRLADFLEAFVKPQADGTSFVEADDKTKRIAITTLAREYLGEFGLKKRELTKLLAGQFGELPIEALPGYRTPSVQSEENRRGSEVFSQPPTPSARGSEASSLVLPPQQRFAPGQSPIDRAFVNSLQSAMNRFSAAEAQEAIEEEAAAAAAPPPIKLTIDGEDYIFSIETAPSNYAEWYEYDSSLTAAKKKSERAKLRTRIQKQGDDQEAAIQYVLDRR